VYSDENTRQSTNNLLSIAHGSLLELETQHLLSVDLKYTKKSEIIESLLEEVSKIPYRMLNPVR